MEEMAMERFPDRVYFLKILYTVLPKYADKFLDKVMEARYRAKPHDFQEKKVINVSSFWMDKLREHKYQSKSKFSFHILTFCIYRQIKEQTIYPH